MWCCFLAIIDASLASEIGVMTMKTIWLALCVGAVLSGCAVQKAVQAPVSMGNDWRIGTDQTPYRSIAPVLLCDGCRE